MGITELIDKIKILLSYYKKKNNISEYRKLFYELQCSEISINPKYFILYEIVNKPFDDKMDKVMLKYTDDIHTTLICFVEYYWKLNNQIQQIILKQDKNTFLSYLNSLLKSKIELNKEEI